VNQKGRRGTKDIDLQHPRCPPEGANAWASGASPSSPGHTGVPRAVVEWLPQQYTPQELALVLRSLQGGRWYLI
jgi:hypothetical protein